MDALPIEVPSRSPASTLRDAPLAPELSGSCSSGGPHEGRGGRCPLGDPDRPPPPRAGVRRERPGRAANSDVPAPGLALTMRTPRATGPQSRALEALRPGGRREPDALAPRDCEKGPLRPRAASPFLQPSGGKLAPSIWRRAARSSRSRPLTSIAQRALMPESHGASAPEMRVDARRARARSPPSGLSDSPPLRRGRRTSLEDVRVKSSARPRPRSLRRCTRCPPAVSPIRRPPAAKGASQAFLLGVADVEVVSLSRDPLDGRLGPHPVGNAELVEPTGLPRRASYPHAKSVLASLRRLTPGGPAPYPGRRRGTIGRSRTRRTFSPPLKPERETLEQSILPLGAL